LELVAELNEDDHHREVFDELKNEVDILLFGDEDGD
jgi:hypothetical protein